MPEFGDGEDLRGGAKRNGQGRGQVKRRVERLRRGGWKESAMAQGCVTWTFEAVRGRSVSDDPLPMLVSFRTRLSATFTTRPSPRLLPSVWLSGTIRHQAFRPSLWARTLVLKDPHGDTKSSIHATIQEDPRCHMVWSIRDRSHTMRL